MCHTGCSLTTYETPKLPPQGSTSSNKATHPNRATPYRQTVKRWSLRGPSLFKYHSRHAQFISFTFKKKKKFSSTGEMVVRYRHLPHIPGDLNSVPETHISGKKEQLYKVVLCPLHAQDGLCAHIHTYTSSSSS